MLVVFPCRCGRGGREGSQHCQGETGGCWAFSVQALQSPAQAIPAEDLLRTAPWLHSLLSFALLFLLVAAWSYNVWLSWHFSSSLCKRSQASAFLYLAITAVVRNTLTEKPVLIFHVSQLHIPARKIFQLRPGCRRWVYLCFVSFFL